MRGTKAENRLNKTAYIHQYSQVHALIIIMHFCSTLPPVKASAVHFTKEQVPIQNEQKVKHKVM